ncbi:MAG: sulfatase-like hydrolase/transferase [Endozoicomonadaceae bacterium]|nr:sulfatase-like hydrolase/transferase [Endozoicomonadaceae bacterium]
MDKQTKIMYFTLIASIFIAVIYIASFTSRFLVNNQVRYIELTSIVCGVLLEFGVALFIIYQIKSKLVKHIISATFVLVITSNIYFNYQYGGLSHGAVASAINSNLIESMEFAKSQNLSYFTVFSFFMLSTILTYSLSHNGKNTKLLISSIFAVTLPIIISTSLYKGYGLSQLIANFTPSLTNANIIRQTFDFIEIENRPINPNWGTVKSSNNTSSYNYIVIIGESVQKKAFPIYNSDYLYTNGQLSGWTFVTNAISPAALTRYSVPRILALNNEEQVDYNKNIIDLSRLAGLNTFWFSNQGSIGRNDTPITRLAKRSDSYEFYNHTFTEASSDSKLLISLGKVLSKKNSGNVIFLHMIGSHSHFCHRVDYQKEHLNYSAQDPSVCYQDSVDRTFDFIKSTEEIAKVNGNKFKIIYFSDHGLTDISNLPFKTHGIGDKFSLNAVEVPLIIIDSVKDGQYSVDYRTYFLRDFPHFYAELIQVDNEHINKNLSLSQCNGCQEPYIYDGELKVQIYE